MVLTALFWLGRYLLLKQIKHSRLAALSNHMDVPRYTLPTVSPYHSITPALNISIETALVNLPPTGRHAADNLNPWPT